jgi:hypothetical protein
MELPRCEKRRFFQWLTSLAILTGMTIPSAAQITLPNTNLPQVSSQSLLRAGGSLGAFNAFRQSPLYMGSGAASSMVMDMQPWIKPDLTSLAHRFGSGTVVDGVNVMTGRHSTQAALGQLSAPGGISYPIVLSYAAPTPRAFLGGIRTTPASPVGFGWSLEFPNIVADNKGTLSLADDDFYANLGPWGGGVLVSDGVASHFHLDTDPRVKIRPLPNATSADLTGWSVEFPDSTVMVLGGSESTRRRMWKSGNKIAQPMLVSREFVSGETVTQRWDIAEIRARGHVGRLAFSWTKSSGGLAWTGTAKYDRESILNKIQGFGAGFTVNGLTGLSVDPAPREIERLDLTWEPMGRDEILPRDAVSQNLPLTRLELPTQSLRKVQYLAGTLVQETSLDYTILAVGSGIGTEKRRLLSSVVMTPRSGAASGTERKWWYTYNTGSTGWLASITDPTMVKTEYLVDYLDVRGTTYLKDSLRIPIQYWAKESLSTLAPKYQSFITQVTDNQSTCLGTFCYQIARIGHIAIGGLSNAPDGRAILQPKSKDIFDASRAVRIYRNVGGGVQKVFDQILPGTVFPGEGYFVSYDYTNNKVWVYEWDGTSFVKTNPFAGDASHEGQTILGLVPGPGYFLVAFKQYDAGVWALNEIVPVVRKAQGWTSLNRNRINGQCDVDMTKDPTGAAVEYGETANWGCLSFGDGAPSNLEYRALDRFFVILDMTKGTIAVFNREGTGFVNTTNRLRALPTSQVPDYWNLYHNGSVYWNLNRVTPHSLTASGDRFMIVTGGSIPGGNYFTAGTQQLSWRWDGTWWQPSIVHIGGVTDAVRTTQMWPSGDGYIEVGQKAMLRRYRNDPASATGGYLTPEATSNGSNVNNELSTSPRLSTSRNYTWLQFHFRPPPMRELSLYPFVHPSEPNWIQGYLFGPNGENKTLETRPQGCPTGLYDLEISPDEKWVTAKCQRKLSGGAWKVCQVLAAGEVCEVTSYQIPFVEADGVTRKIQPFSTWIPINTSTINQPYDPGYEVSRGQGMTMLTWGRPDSLYVRIHPSFFDGIKPSSAIAANLDGAVISKVVRTSLHQKSGASRLRTATQFTYGKWGDSLSFDGSSLTPESRVTTVSHLGKTDQDVISTEQISHWGLSPYSGTFNPKVPEFVGSLRSRRNFARDNSSGMISASQVLLRNGPGWSKSVALVRDSSIEHVAMDARGGKQTSKSVVGSWNLLAIQPQVTLQLLNDNSVIQDGTASATFRHQASVTNFNSNGRPTEVRTGLFKSRAAATALLTSTTWFSDLNLAISAGNALPVSGSRSTYLANQIDVDRSLVWGARNPDADATKFDAGQVVSYPDFNLGWSETQYAGVRAKNNMPLQTVSVSDPSTPISSLVVLEGERGVVSARISPAWAEDVAVLTAEDGIVGLHGNTWNGATGAGRWALPGLGSKIRFDTLPHLGRYSMRVLESDGPTARLRLQDRSTMRSGLTVSAWVYTPGIAPVLRAQLQSISSGAVLKTWSAAAPTGGLKPRAWQRWEVIIPYAELKSAGALTVGTNATTELVITCGPGSTAAAGSVLWVDNLVAKPISASLSLQSVDALGRVIGRMDGKGNWSKLEYDINGTLQAERDALGRIRAQSALLEGGDL